MRNRILNYNEAKAYLKTMKFKTKEDYSNWYAEKRPNFLPANPQEYYKGRVEEIGYWNTLAAQGHQYELFCDVDNPIHFYSLIEHDDDLVEEWKASEEMDTIQGSDVHGDLCWCDSSLKAEEAFDWAVGIGAKFYPIGDGNGNFIGHGYFDDDYWKKCKYENEKYNMELEAEIENEVNTDLNYIWQADLMEQEAFETDGYLSEFEEGNQAIPDILFNEGVTGNLNQIETILKKNNTDSINEII